MFLQFPFKKHYFDKHPWWAITGSLDPIFIFSLNWLCMEHHDICHQIHLSLTVTNINSTKIDQQVPNFNFLNFHPILMQFLLLQNGWSLESIQKVRNHSSVEPLNNLKTKVNGMILWCLLQNVCFVSTGNPYLNLWKSEEVKNA